MGRFALSLMGSSVFALALAGSDARAQSPAPTTAGFAPAVSPETAAPSASSEPSAEPSTPTTSQDVSWSLTGRGGYLSPPIRGGTTPFGAGFGGAFGITVSNIYIAASIVYFLGGTDVTISDHSLFYGLDVGYAIKLARLGGGDLILRPQVSGGGVTIYHTDPSTAKVDVVSSASGTTTNRTSDTTTLNAFYVTPSVTLLYTTERFLVGLNGSTVFLPGVDYSGAGPTTWISYGLEAQVGVRF